MQITNTYELTKLDIVKNSLKLILGKGEIAKVNKLSLRNVFEELVIFHDIDEMASSGYIVIKEQSNLIKNFPVVGWERIDIEFTVTGEDGSPYQPYSNSFYVYAVDNMNEQKDIKQYVIRFASAAAMLNVSSRLEQRYQGKAETILYQIAGSQVFAGIPNAFILNASIGTKFDLDIIAPSWKPFQFMQRVASLAVSSDGEFSDCLLFPQVNGMYEFTSYRTIKARQAVNIVKKPQQVNNGNNNQSAPVIKDPYTIKEYAIGTLFDNQSFAAGGIYGNIAKMFDFSTMTYETFINYYDKSGKYSAIPGSQLQNLGKSDGYNTTEYDLSEIFGNNAKYMFPSEYGSQRRYYGIRQSPEANISFTLCGLDQTSVSNANSSVNGSAHDTPMYAVSRGIPGRRTMKTQSAVLNLNPCSDLRIGQLVNINMQSGDGDPDNTLYINGQWFIGKIKYTLTDTNMNVDIECFKNTLNV